VGNSEIYKMGREFIPQLREPVEEMEEKQSQLQVWRSPLDFQETLEFLLDEQNRNVHKCLDMTNIEMGEEEAKMIGDALALHPSLEMLVIKLDSVHEAAEKLALPTSMWPMDSFLTAAFLEEKHNTSLVSLIISSSGTDGEVMRLGVLPQVISGSTGLRKFAIQ
jgi:hypothetical protein